MYHFSKQSKDPVEVHLFRFHKVTTCGYKLTTLSYRNLATQVRPTTCWVETHVKHNDISYTPLVFIPSWRIQNLSQNIIYIKACYICNPILPVVSFPAKRLNLRSLSPSQIFRARQQSKEHQKMPLLPWWNRETSPAIREYHGIGKATNLIQLDIWEWRGPRNFHDWIQHFADKNYEKRKTNRLGSVLNFEKAVPIFDFSLNFTVSWGLPVGKKYNIFPIFISQSANPEKSNLKA